MGGEYSLIYNLIISLKWGFFGHPGRQPKPNEYATLIQQRERGCVVLILFRGNINELHAYIYLPDIGMMWNIFVNNEQSDKR